MLLSWRRTASSFLASVAVFVVAAVVVYLTAVLPSDATDVLSVRWNLREALGSPASDRDKTPTDRHHDPRFIVRRTYLLLVTDVQVFLSVGIALAATLVLVSVFATPPLLKRVIRRIDENSRTDSSG